MLEIQVHAGQFQPKPVSKSVSVSETVNVLLNLNSLLDKTKFYGTIELKYEAGRLLYVKTQQNFTVDSLAHYLESE